MPRVGAIADIHASVGEEDKLRDMFAAFDANLDVLIIPGDLTDSGTQEEAYVIAKVLKDLAYSVVVVLGNHDYHQDQQAEIREILEAHNVVVLDGEGWTYEADGISIGFAGSTGFGGGFRPHNLEPFGERAWKTLLEKVIEESRKLDRGLTDVDGADHLIAVTHYSPTIDTMDGEPESIYPFLGSSELGDAIDRHRVLFAVHGHAHRGRVQGRTTSGTSVYNVAHTVVDYPLIWRFDGTERPPEPDWMPDGIEVQSQTEGH